MEVKDLYKSYGSLAVLQGVSLHCAPGEMLGLLGANGAGKSTLFKIIFGLVKPDSGTVWVPQGKVKPLGGIIEKPGLYDYLSAAENIQVFARVQGIKTSPAFIRSCLTQVGLDPNRKDPVQRFSMGMRQRLGIAIALLNDPAVLVLDEPFNGLDPLGVATLRDLIQSLCDDKGLAILLSSHITEELARTCHRLCVLKGGKMIHSGPTQEILSAHTLGYALYGKDLAHSKSLQAYPHHIRGQMAWVDIGADQISSLLKALLAEGIPVESCIPDYSMQELFETPTV
ncbi:MAG: ABC transporter ATP-binding protein [Sphingobacteriia bacterium]|nr:MAG: ABC transporter ATP-binding protein [Sphingobacteriia bacterium]